MRATRKIVFTSVLSILAVGAVTAQQNRIKSVDTQSSITTPRVHNLSWYPHEELPPFVSTLVEAGDDTIDTIYAGNAVFTTEEAPPIPARMEKPEFRGREFVPGYFIVHFDDELRATDKEFLVEKTGDVKRADGTKVVRWYIPNNALITWVDTAAVLRTLRNSLRVDWVGRYQPAYKIDPSIGSAMLQSPDRLGRGFYRLNVDLIPGHSMQEVSRAINQLGGSIHEQVEVRGERGYDVRFLVVDAAPSLVTKIADIEGVRMIQETGDGLARYDLSGGGKLQNRSITQDDQTASPIVTSSGYPLWLTHNLQGQGQLIGVVDTSFDWNNSGTSGCNFGYPDTNIDNYGMALPNLSRVLLSSVGSGGVNLKIPRGDALGGATLQGAAAATNNGEHGAGVAGAALGDYYGNNDTKWWEHDVDNWEGWAPTNYSGLMGPGIAHEAQLFATPVMNSSGAFRWEFAGEFETNMNTTLDNMAAAGVCTTNHSVGLAEASNTYTQVTVTHDTNAYDHPEMLQCMAAGNDGATSNALTSQAVTKNGLAVGASDDVLKPEDRVSFSSIGPRFDGAIKPDVMAPGSDTFGRAGGVASSLILPNSNGTSSASCSYQYTQGTSFSSPIMAGAGALVHQYFEEGNYPGLSTASASLMKGTLINAGHRLTGALLGDNTYPNNYQGWGEPNLSDVLDFGAGARRLIAKDVASAQGFTSSGSSNDDYTINVNGSGEPFRVTLVWTDEPGSTGTGKKLINDLHLTVVSPGGTTYRGNNFNGSTGLTVSGGSADTLNNVENVFLNSPQLGTWTVTVDPSVGNYAAGQGYALVVTGDVSEGAPPQPPVAGFSASPTSGTVPLNVNFTDLSTGSITSYSWNFGDSGTSTAQNPSHTYTSVGTYTVSLTVTGPGGNDTETQTNVITVNQVAAPVAGFGASPTSGTVPLNVNFTDGSTGSITSWSWTFGDGGTSNAQNPSHNYTSAGTYTVSLTVTGPGGNDTDTQTNLITASNPPAPVASFNATPTSGDAPLNVAFSDTSTGSITSWSWTFGDGGTSTSQSPNHTYNTAGTYSVALTVTGPGGNDTQTQSGLITVNDPPPGPPIADFNATPTSGTTPLNVAFSDASTGSITSYSWTFGDGGTSTAQNPNHTYNSAGTYTVSLTTTGPGGNDTETKSNLITVSDPVLPPVASFGASPTNGDAPLNVVFTNGSTGSITSYSWTFGDGGTSTATNPSHVYTVAGTYTVSLTATGPGGSDIDTQTNLITVTDPPGGGLGLYYLTFTSNTAVPGVGTVRDEDVVTYDPDTGNWEWYFDGSDVGIGGTDINALHVLDDGSLVMSFNSSSVSVPGLIGGPNGTTVEDSDLILFSFTSSGSSTSGSFTFVFDGSDVGLTTNGEDIDGIYEFPGGGLAVSTVGSSSTPGYSGGRDEDVFFFSATQLGAATVGAWSFYFDGSDVGFSNSSSEDLNAVSFDAGIDLLFSTVGSYSASGGAGADEDIGRFSGTFGSSTSGSAALELDLSSIGISTGEDVDGMHFQP